MRCAVRAMRGCGAREGEKVGSRQVGAGQTRMQCEDARGVEGAHCSRLPARVGPPVHARHVQRMREEERDADWLIKNGFLDKIEDIEVDGEVIKGSVLGYRINSKFVAAFFGRVFQNPHLVFDEDMLKPELQDLKSYAESVKTIVVVSCPRDRECVIAFRSV